MWGASRPLRGCWRYPGVRGLIFPSVFSRPALCPGERRGAWASGTPRGEAPGRVEDTPHHHQPSLTPPRHTPPHPAPRRAAPGPAPLPQPLPVPRRLPGMRKPLVPLGGGSGSTRAVFCGLGAWPVVRGEQRDASGGQAVSQGGRGWGRGAPVTSQPGAGIFRGGGWKRGPVLVRWLCGILQALKVRLIACALRLCWWEEGRDSLGLSTGTTSAQGSEGDDDLS